MQIQIHTDHNVHGHEPLSEHVRGVVESSMSRYGERITSVIVHLGDENGAKNGQHDRRCMMEARLAGHSPTAVTHHAVSIDEAIEGASHKLVSALDSLTGRLDHR